MRVRRPLGYALHLDPRHYRFPLPNGVWEYKLRPAEFVILSYLCYQTVHGRGKTVSAKTVADALHLSVVTVEKHLATLKGKGVLSWERAPEKFFSLPNEIFLLDLPPSAFVVYAYLLTCEDRRTHRCHPSYRTMAKMTGLSLNTVTKAVGVLLDKRLIAAEYTHWFNEQGLKRKGNNVYTVLPIQFAVSEFHQRQLAYGGSQTAEKSAG